MGLPAGAHPRLRGEHHEPAEAKTPCTGSSPLTRGAPDIACSFLPPMGLIPAYAGSTLHSGGGSSGSRAHPRLRGEHRKEPDTMTAFDGSSPLTRGAPNRRCTGPDSRGLIPAYAGSTLQTAQPRQRRRAHPRLRGEHPIKPFIKSVKYGSSPLTRGARGWLPLPHRQ